MLTKKLCCGLMMFFFWVSPALSAETMKIVYFNDFAPYSWEEDNQMKGILIDILNEVLQKEMGINLSHQGYPWARAQRMVESGQADAFATVPTPVRREYTEISNEPVLVADFTLFVKTGNPRIPEFQQNIKAISDLKGIKLGDYIGNGWAEQNLKGMDVDWSSSALDETLKKLARGRFDIYVGTRQVTFYNVKKLGLNDEITEIYNVMDSVSWNLCIGKKSTFVGQLPKFDETVKRVREQGKFEAIYQQYR